ncbi:3'(2'),5'-bisphosphate nucleotidase CysQ family protein [Neosynechococcus sphagnicola]|uniref:3'(2'),5'-bisphosphate nucleotidase CysQ family protein n=1 Tax=Neosynechococcus sphagnicola TaxID=1501145 RepID=UPI000B169EF8|nr:inositol monophosphatase family protein [Neosynechococcus sphagnicola]
MTSLLSSRDAIYDRLDEILAIARPIGWEAANILRSYYRGEPKRGDLAVDEQQDGPVTAADIAVNHFILSQLQSDLGTQDFAYLSEETYKTQPTSEWMNRPWVWIVDPLDGTRDFIDRTGEYAVHIALVHQGRPVLSVVACPEAERLYAARLGGGAFVDTPEGIRTRLQVSDRDRPQDLTLVVSRTHRDQRFNQLLQELPCQHQLYVGSVGCKIAAIVDQRADVYISLSGKSAPKDWDMAAPELILTEAGGQFTHFDGSPLKYSQGDVNQSGGVDGEQWPLPCNTMC